MADSLSIATDEAGSEERKRSCEKSSPFVIICVYPQARRDGAKNPEFHYNYGKIFEHKSDGLEKDYRKRTSTV